MLNGSPPPKGGWLRTLDSAFLITTKNKWMCFKISRLNHLTSRVHWIYADIQWDKIKVLRKGKNTYHDIFSTSKTVHPIHSYPVELLFCLLIVRYMLAKMLPIMEEYEARERVRIDDPFTRTCGWKYELYVLNFDALFSESTKTHLPVSAITGQLRKSKVEQLVGCESRKALGTRMLPQFMGLDFMVFLTPDCRI